MFTCESREAIMFTWGSREAGVYLGVERSCCSPGGQEKTKVNLGVKKSGRPGSQEKLKFTWESREAEVYLGVKRS